MAEREETVTVEQTETYYECDKCHGRNHDETQNEHMLNKVIFGASVYQTKKLGNMGEYEYLLCDECMERAHDYLTDFF